jgi:hypothetical protein
MYRQLDEATFERFEPFGRVRDIKRMEGVLQLVGRDTETGALVRYIAQPPDWSASDGPEEFTHWLIHRHHIGEGFGWGPGLVAAIHHEFALLWNGTTKRVCDAPRLWHVNDGTPAWVRELDRPRQVEMRQRRCKVNLDELTRQWQEKADSQLHKMLKAQAKYDEFKALPLIVLARLKRLGRRGGPGLHLRKATVYPLWAQEEPGTDSLTPLSFRTHESPASTFH